jgi:DNA-binding LytR/AlgR family response regulator
MNGRQMADAARVGRPGLKVLFITGYAENAVIGKAQLESDMHVITKPFAMDMLAIRIRSIIQGGDAAPKPHISFAVASSMSRSDPNLTEPE